MALSDWKFPNPVPYVETVPTIMQGGLTYWYRTDGNDYRRWITKTVKTFIIDDYSITPSAGNDFETDYFTLVELPNGYKVKLKVWQQQAPSPYHFWQTRLYDESDNIIPAATIPSITGYNQSGSQAGVLYMPTECVKIAVFTYYPMDAATGMEPTSFGIKAFWGRLTDTEHASAMNLPAFGDVVQCTTSSTLDQLHARHIFDILVINDIDAANEYIKTHGNPTDKNFIGETDYPGETDPSQPGGGDGNYDDRSDPIDFPNMPVGGALACGAIHAFNVNTTHIQTIFQKLWSTSIFDMSMWQKLVSSPLDCIVSLHCLPCQPTQGSDAHIWFGNFDTNVTAKLVSSQYLIVDCGSITLNKFFGTAMDFSPYTRVSIYLPFSGIHDLATEDVQGSTIHIKYYVDVLTGDCNIQVKCGQSVLYKFTGNCKMGIPVTSRDDNALGNTIKGTLGMIGGAILGGAIGSAPGAIAGATLSAAASVAMHKETVSRSGEITSNVGLMDDFRPYLIIHRPQQSLARDYNKFKGYPSNLTLTLSSCNGYTEIEHIHLTGITGATDTELNMIESQLKEGVII